MESLGNPPVPAGAAIAQITGNLFKNWMKKATKNLNVSDNNPFQIVAYLYQKADMTVGNEKITPNWHLTMMSDFRDCSVSKNFHFKIEIGKPYSHYWHYVLCRHPGTQTWSWAGAANPQIATTNQGGGGAGASQQKLNENYTLVLSQARQQQMDGQVTSRSINRLVTLLTQADQGGKLLVLPNGTWDGQV